MPLEIHCGQVSLNSDRSTGYSRQEDIDGWRRGVDGVVTMMYAIWLLRSDQFSALLYTLTAESPSTYRRTGARPASALSLPLSASVTKREGGVLPTGSAS